MTPTDRHSPRGFLVTPGERIRIRLHASAAGSQAGIVHISGAQELKQSVDEITFVVPKKSSTAVRLSVVGQFPDSKSGSVRSEDAVSLVIERGIGSVEHLLQPGHGLQSWTYHFLAAKSGPAFYVCTGCGEPARKGKNGLSECHSKPVVSVQV